MDTGPLPVLPPMAARRPGGRSARETSVDELFGYFAPPARGGATAAEAQLVIEPSAEPDDAGHDQADGADAADAAGAERDDGTVVEFERRARRGRHQHPAASPTPDNVTDIGRAARLRVVPDASGPRVPLGLVWFAVGAAALLASRFVALALFGVVATVAAVQTAAALRKRGRRSRPMVAGGCAAVVAAAAVAPTSRVVGLAVLIAVVATLISALHIGGFDVESAGLTVRSWIGPALAVAGPIAFATLEPALGVLLFVLVCTYDAGDYLIGTASSNGLEGPVAGIVGVVAVGCGAAVLAPGALAHYSLWPAVAVTAIACPSGQLLASASLPYSGAFAPALRRIDSLIVVAPLWMLLFS